MSNYIYQSIISNKQDMRFEGGGIIPLIRDLNLWYRFDKVWVFLGGGVRKKWYFNNIHK